MEVWQIVALAGLVTFAFVFVLSLCLISADADRRAQRMRDAEQTDAALQRSREALQRQARRRIVARKVRAEYGYDPRLVRMHGLQRRGSWGTGEDDEPEAVRR